MFEQSATAADRENLIELFETNIRAEYKKSVEQIKMFIFQMLKN